MSFCKTGRTVLVFLLSVFLMEKAGADVPENLTVSEIFKPGIGLPVGKIQLVQGQVILIHKDRAVGYKAENDLPLFEGDTVITREKARIRLELNDGSLLTMASKTEITVNQSLYDPESETRSSFLRMLAGKARFLIKKLAEFKLSEFRVKTKTAVIGVRGSDFIVEADADRTQVTALENTNIEVVGLVGPEAEPAVLKDFEQTVIEAGSLPSKIEGLVPEHIEIMKKDFLSVPEGSETEDRPEMQPPVSKPDETGESAISPHVRIEDRDIFVPDDALVNPEEAGMFGKSLSPGESEFTEKKGPEPKKEGELMSPDMDKINPDRGDSTFPDLQDKIHEDKMRKEPLPPSPENNSLPPFPDPPGGNSDGN